MLEVTWKPMQFLYLLSFSKQFHQIFEKKQILSLSGPMKLKIYWIVRYMLQWCHWSLKCIWQRRCYGFGMNGGQVILPCLQSLANKKLRRCFISAENKLIKKQTHFKYLIFASRKQPSWKQARYNQVIAHQPKNKILRCGINPSRWHTGDGR